MVPKNIQDVLTDFVSKQKVIYGDTLVSIILYGSYARGDYSEGSDVDVMVLTTIEDDADLYDKKCAMYDSVYDYQL